MQPTQQLRLMSTVLIAFAVAQAGFGSGFLDGEAGGLLIAHATNAFAFLVLSALSAVLGLGYRRSGGARWTFWLPVGITVAAVLQMFLGFSEIRGLHIFLGVLILCGVTTYCSYTWRLLPKDTPRRAAPTP